MGETQITDRKRTGTIRALIMVFARQKVGLATSAISDDNLNYNDNTCLTPSASSGDSANWTHPPLELLGLWTNFNLQRHLVSRI